MGDQIQIRAVKVELLRTGPSHNQLLSPLTTYLGICDGAEAGVVNVPFEHQAFLRKLNAMGVDQDARDRAPVMRELGVEIARMLGAIPRLPGSLSTDAAGPDTLIHLRLVLSASELALLPFELTKIPIGPSTWAEGWLSLQVRVPVVVTRRTRDTPDAKARWSTPPRVLFVAGDPDRDHLPFDEHRDALVAAMRPYMKSAQAASTTSDDGKREEFAGWLTILRNASFDDVVAECAKERYTHVHLLAHGIPDDNVEGESYGLKLHPAPGHDEVISGERFASAFATLIDGHIHRPTVVTLATCDSGDEGSVLIPGASIAHVLHQAGISLVIASQFPLSMPGSSLLVNELYPGLLKGDHPLPLLHRIRTDLHGRLSIGGNDWASLVVYEALPVDLAEQLDEVRYLQATRAVHVAFGELDRAMLAANDRLSLQEHLDRADRVESLVRLLPIDGPYRLECLGLRAGSSKRLAEASFWTARALGAQSQAGLDAAAVQALDHAMSRHLSDCYGYLEDALKDYCIAAGGLLRNQGRGWRDTSSLHWLLGQQLCLSAVLGVPVADGTWETARRSAEAYLDGDDADGRRWAHGTLTELWLLRLTDAAQIALHKTDPGEATKRRRLAEHEAQKHAAELIKGARSHGDEQVAATLNQLQRFDDWWSHELFEWAADSWPGNRSSQPPSWRELGVDQVARDLIGILENRGRGKRGTWNYPGIGTFVAADGSDAGEAREAAPSAAPVAIAPPLIAPIAAPADLPSMRPAAAAPTPAAEPVIATDDEDAVIGRSTDAVPVAAKAVSFLGGAAAGAPFFRIEMLPAQHGDCVWIEYGSGGRTNRVLVDCGTDSTYAHFLKPRIERGKKDAGTPSGLAFELFILTHIDDDHIGGGIEMLKDAKALSLSFGDVWFNGWKHIQDTLGAVEGEQFSELIEQNQLTWIGWLGGRTVVVPDQGPLPTCTLPGGMVLTLLSPDRLKLQKLAQKWAKDVKAQGKGLKPGQDGFLFLGGGAAAPKRSDSTDLATLLKTPFTEDDAPHNGSSITVLAEFGGKALLLGADVHPLLLAASIERLLAARHLDPKKDRLKLDAFKVPHHGSQNNLDQSVLDLVDCSNYRVDRRQRVPASGQRGDRAGHPLRAPRRVATAAVVQLRERREPSVEGPGAAAEGRLRRDLSDAVGDAAGTGDFAVRPVDTPRRDSRLRADGARAPPGGAMQYPGRIIQLGETDAAVVAALKARLNEALVLPPDQALDVSAPAFDDLTASAVKAFQAVSADAEGQPLKPDGIVGAITWAALFGDDRVPAQATTDDAFLAQLLAVAAAEEARNVREDPVGSNGGTYVDAYLASVGLPGGNSWCAAFVYWCSGKAAQALGRSDPLFRTGGCLAHWNGAPGKGARRVTAADALADPSRVKPGMIFIMDHGGGFGHTGLVESVAGGMITTVEGNSNNAGSREGIGVFRLTRKINTINTGFIDYAGL